jgi:D-amino-acid oxidase
MVSQADPDVLVIGAGVIGLSSALALLGAGLRVSIYAADPPLRTTSAAAGALWGAHLVGADDRIGRWAARTLQRLRELAADPATGVREAAGIAASAAGLTEAPGFASGAGALTRCPAPALPAGYRSGWQYTAPVVAMPTYLEYLAGQVIEAGGQLRFGPPLGGIAEAAAHSTAPVVVNCAGIGAASLVADPDLIPVRGQVVIVANPGLTDFFVGEREQPGEVTYIFPHGPTAVLGGTHQEGDWTLRPDPATARHIVRACAAVEPALADARVLDHRVGLRPVRPHVCLGTRSKPAAGLNPPTGPFWVDNYGHGGAGVTLSWGCALDVRDLVVGLLG